MVSIFCGKAMLLYHAPEDAKFIAFRVCEDDPILLALTNVYAGCAQAKQTFHFLVLCRTCRIDVDVEAILCCLGLGNLDEEQCRRSRPGNSGPV